MSVETAKVAIRELLGDVKQLPMIFDGKTFCPECLWATMGIAGNYWICPKCGFSCRATPIVDKQGQNWLRLVDSI